ncbi:hypothetical protein BY996DRAFT_6513670 [Phakopsora pachyrhizi]|nr:hypothetical protein BY996DRAFT_6513670 [Phakopsora pachyrhizi]
MERTRTSPQEIGGYCEGRRKGLPRRLEASPKSKIKKSTPLKKKGERYEEVLELIPAPGDNVLPKKESS